MGLFSGTPKNSNTYGSLIISDFKFAMASYNSVYGKVESGWERKGDKLEFSITIPANCTADICLPGREPELVGAGVYLRKV